MSADRQDVDDTLRAVEELPAVDQTRMEKMARLMAARRWPHDVEAMAMWTPAQFREVLDSLSDEP